jgi:hypothetical protein
MASFIANLPQKIIEEYIFFIRQNCDKIGMYLLMSLFTNFIAVEDEKYLLYK